MINLDRPTKLICVERDNIYTTEDELFIIKADRQKGGWIVARRDGRSAPIWVAMMGQAVQEIKAQLRGARR